MFLDDQLKQQRCAFGVRVYEGAEIREIVLVRSKVNDSGNPPQRLVEIVAIGDIALNKLRFARNIVRLAARMNARLQVVEDAHLVAPLEKQVYGVRPDKPGPACYQNFHV